MTLSVRAFPALLFVLAAGCGSTPEENLPVPHEIDITPAVLSLELGGTQQLAIVVLDADAQPIANAPLTFTSRDTTVVRVSSAGLVSAVGVGSTSVTVRSDPASATVPVTVVSPPTPAWLQLTTPAAVLALSQTAQLDATVYDSVGNPLPAAPVTFVSRDPTLVTVSATGLVTAVDVGTTYVVATSGLVSDSVYITGVVARVTVSASRLFAAAVSAAGVAYVTLPDLDGVVRLDLPTPAVTGTFTVGFRPSSVTFNNVGDRAYFGNQDAASVSVVNVAANTVIATPAFHGSVLGVAVAAGDTLLFVATDAHEIYFVRLPSLTVTDSVAVSGYSNAMVVRGTLLYASSPTAGLVSEIDIGTHQVVRTFFVGGTPQGLAIPPTGNDLYIANETGILQIWNLTTNALTGQVPLEGGGGFGIARNPANGLLFVSTSYYGSRVHVIDPGTRSVVRVIRTGGVPRRIAFTASGSVGIVANEGGWVDFIH
jgi:YVTN family beta-propeller protein